MLDDVSTRQGAEMSNESRPSDRQLEAHLGVVSERIRRLEEAIGELQGAAILRKDAAARLVIYRRNYERLQHERRTLELENEMSHRPREPDVSARTLPDEMLEQARQEKDDQKKRRWLRS
jgi:hypothetical protein